MGAHKVDDFISSEFRKMAGADDRVFAPAPDVVDARLELDDVVDVGSTVNPPVHSADNTAK